jgi:hypothetical protein
MPNTCLYKNSNVALAGSVSKPTHDARMLDRTKMRPPSPRHLCRMPLAVKEDEPPRPFDIRIFSSDTVMPQANFRARTV